jgi:hypothetical protein
MSLRDLFGCGVSDAERTTAPPDAEDDPYLDGFTGWHSRRDELAEKNRVEALERRLAAEQQDRESPDMSGFEFRPPNIQAANLPTSDG